MEASRTFFGRPLREKAAHVSDLTYSGYVASGEEETAGEKDGSEVFTVCPDIPETTPASPANGPATVRSPGHRPATRPR